MVQVHGFHLWRLVADAERWRRHRKRLSSLSGSTPSKPSRRGTDCAEDEFVTINTASLQVLITRSELHTMFVLKHRFSIFTRFYVLRAFCAWRDVLYLTQLEHCAAINCDLVKETTQARMLLKYAAWRDDKALLMKVVSAWVGSLHAKRVARLQRAALEAKCRIFLRAGDVRDPFLLHYWTLWILQAGKLRDARRQKEMQRNALRLAEVKFQERLTRAHNIMLEQRELIINTADAELKRLLRLHHERRGRSEAFDIARPAHTPSGPPCYSPCTTSPNGSPSLYSSPRPPARPGKQVPHSTADPSQSISRNGFPHPYTADISVYSSSRGHVRSVLPENRRHHDVSGEFARRDVLVPQGSISPLGLSVPPRSISPHGLSVPPRSVSPRGLSASPRNICPHSVSVPPGSISPPGLSASPRNICPHGVSVPPRSISPHGLSVPPRSISPRGLSESPRNICPHSVSVPPINISANSLRVPPRMESFDRPVERDDRIDGVAQPSVPSYGEVNGSCVGAQIRRSPREARTAGERPPFPREESQTFAGFPVPPGPDGPGGKQFASPQSVMWYVGASRMHNQSRSCSAPPSVARRHMQELWGDEYPVQDGRTDSGVPHLVTSSQWDAGYRDALAGHSTALSSTKPSIDIDDKATTTNAFTPGDVRRPAVSPSPAKATNAVDAGAPRVAASSPLMAPDGTSASSLEHVLATRGASIATPALPPSAVKVTPPPTPSLPPGKARSRATTASLPPPAIRATPPPMHSLPPAKAAPSPTPSLSLAMETSSATTTPLPPAAAIVAPPPTLSQHHTRKTSDATTVTRDSLNSQEHKWTTSSLPLFATTGLLSPAAAIVAPPPMLPLPPASETSTTSAGTHPPVPAKLALPPVPAKLALPPVPAKVAPPEAVETDIAGLTIPLSRKIDQHKYAFVGASGSPISREDWKLAFAPAMREGDPPSDATTVALPVISVPNIRGNSPSQHSGTSALPREVGSSSDVSPLIVPALSVSQPFVRSSMRSRNSARKGERALLNAFLPMPREIAEGVSGEGRSTRLLSTATGTDLVPSLVAERPTLPTADVAVYDILAQNECVPASPLRDFQLPSASPIELPTESQPQIRNHQNARVENDATIHSPSPPLARTSHNVPPSNTDEPSWERNAQQIDVAAARARSPLLSPPMRPSPLMDKTLTGARGAHAHVNAQNEYPPGAWLFDSCCAVPRYAGVARSNGGAGNADSHPRKPLGTTAAPPAMHHAWVAPSNQEVPAMGFRIERKAIKVSTTCARVPTGHRLDSPNKSLRPTNPAPLHAPRAIASPPISPTSQCSVVYPRAYPAFSSSQMVQCAYEPACANAVIMGTTLTEQHHAPPVNSSIKRSCTPARTTLARTSTYQASCSQSSHVGVCFSRSVKQSPCSKCTEAVAQCLCGNNPSLPGARRVSPGRLETLTSIRQINGACASSTDKVGPASLPTPITAMVSTSTQYGGIATYGIRKPDGPVLLRAVESGRDARRSPFTPSGPSQTRARSAPSSFRDEAPRAFCRGATTYQQPPSLPGPATRSPCPPAAQAPSAPHTLTACKSGILPLSGALLVSSNVSPPTSLVPQSPVPHTLSPSTPSYQPLPVAYAPPPPTSPVPSPSAPHARSQSTQRTPHPPPSSPSKNAHAAFPPVRDLLPPPTMRSASATSPDSWLSIPLELLPPPALDSSVQHTRGRSATSCSSTRNSTPTVVTYHTNVDVSSYRAPQDARRAASVCTPANTTPANGLSPPPLRTNAPQHHVAESASRTAPHIRVPHRPSPRHLFHAPTATSSVPTYVQRLHQHPVAPVSFQHGGHAWPTVA